MCASGSRLVGPFFVERRFGGHWKLWFGPTFPEFHRTFKNIWPFSAIFIASPAIFVPIPCNIAWSVFLRRGSPIIPSAISGKRPLILTLQDMVKTIRFSLGLSNDAKSHSNVKHPGHQWLVRGDVTANSQGIASISNLPLRKSVDLVIDVAVKSLSRNRSATASSF